jgi:hypothetical protein
MFEMYQTAPIAAAAGALPMMQDTAALELSSIVR